VTQFSETIIWINTTVF